MPVQAVLATLLKLAIIDSETAERSLGLALRAKNVAARDLDDLKHRRDDYAAAHKMIAGLNAGAYRNYQQFIQVIEQSITAQEAVILVAQSRVDAARRVMQRCQQSRQAYETLAAKAQAQHGFLVARKEQMQDDELQFSFKTHRSLRRIGSKR